MHFLMFLSVFVFATSCVTEPRSNENLDSHQPSGPLFVTAPPPAQVRFTEVEFVHPKPRLYYGDMNQAMCGVNCQCDREKSSFSWPPENESKWPCVLEAIRVFREIREYQEIRMWEMKPGDASYHALLARANDRFYKAILSTLKALEMRHGFSYDMVLEKGHMKLKKGSKAKAIPEITNEVLKRIRR